MFGHLVPEAPAAAGASRDRFEIENPFRRKSGGLIRQPVERGDKQAGRRRARRNRRRPAPRSARASAAAANAGLRRPSARSTGLTDEARSAGARPNRKRHAAGQRQAECQHPPVRGKNQARRIVRRIDHAHDERRGPPGEQRRRWPRRGTPARRSPPAPVAPAATRPAPIETRSAISRARAAAWAVIRLATLAHAISSTSATSTPKARQRPAGSRAAVRAPGGGGLEQQLLLEESVAIAVWTCR